MLILAVSKNFNKLFQYGCLTSVASLSELRRIVIMAVDLIFVFIVAVLCAKDGRTHRAGEVLDVVFSIKRRNIGTSKCSSTREAEKIETTEVICFT